LSWAALDKETLTRVLSEFVKSPYAKQLFEESNVQVRGRGKGLG
jgi:hypothetical protein